MTDREILEFAAKAYWADEIDDVVSIKWIDSDGCIEFTHADNQDHNGRDVGVLWNPLADDGDALRLAVKLELEVSLGQFGTIIYSGCGKVEEIGEDGCDEMALCRRAITRAAAEIGKEMK